MNSLTHTQPTVSLTLTVNIHADKALLFLAGVLWLAARLFSRGLVTACTRSVGVIRAAKFWLIDDWGRDWRMICEAARLLFMREVSYGTP